MSVSRDIHDSCFLPCVLEVNRVLLIADKVGGICADFLHIIAAHRSFSFEEVPYGTWTIREIESPKGYVLSEEEISVTIGEVAIFPSPLASE